MVRFLALLATLVAVNACNAGPLQWSDAETWSATDSWVTCEREMDLDFPSGTACDALRGAIVGTTGSPRPPRQVNGRNIVLGFDRCTTTLRANDTVDPSTCAFTFVTGDDIRSPRRSYALTLTATAVEVTRESWRVQTRVRWTMRGTVIEGTTTRDVLGRAFTFTGLLPVR